MATPIKCYMYTRVSTLLQVDNYGFKAQKETISDYAQKHNMTIVREYSDAGFSGKNIQGRPDFMRMLDDIQNQKDDISYVLVFKLSRFGRSAADVLNSLQILQDYGVNLCCVEDNIDSGQSYGKIMITILSLVAEIERENIGVQTMAGRIEKAREGRWNGGIPPYGYTLVNGELFIDEEEAEIIREIYKQFLSHGINAVAKYMNSHGYRRKIHKNGKYEGFSYEFVQSVLDNPVYKGKIAYGRRKKEKIPGTRNETHVVKQSTYQEYEGLHEAIIDEDLWNKAHEKRQKESFVREKVRDPEHAHILSGLLICPSCGRKLYGNISKAHSKDNKTRYYYYCKNTVSPTGQPCTFRYNMEQTELNAYIARIISLMVNNDKFGEAIKDKIGESIDISNFEKQLKELEKQRNQAVATKNRLGNQMDTLDTDDSHYDNKMEDLQTRYDNQYNIIEEKNNEIEEIENQIKTIKQNIISKDNIYTLLQGFDSVYNDATEVERKRLMRTFIERIEIFPEKQESGNWIKKIVFKFPMPVNGQEVLELPLEGLTIDETVVSLSQQTPKMTVDVTVDLDEFDTTPTETKATYKEIEDYIFKKYKLKVSNLYIAQIKQKYGIIERENYNKPKSANSKQPKCPPEKEKIIVEALRHFQMI